MNEINVEKLLAGTVSPLTVSAYAIAWRQYLLFAGTRRRALRAETLAEWRQFMVGETELSRSTINKNLFGAKAIVKALFEQKQVSREVAWEFRDVATLPANALTSRRRAHTRTRVSPEEMRRMIDATEAEPCELIRLYHRAFLLTLATTGLRISECCRIRRSDIEARGHHCVITRVMAKAKGEPRDVPVGSEACAAIAEWVAARPNDSDYLFNVTGYGDGMRYSDAPVNRATAADIVYRYAEKAGLQHITPHSLRRFVGTELVRKHGIRVAQMQLGHANISTTAKFYDLSPIDGSTVEGLF